jgi:hypothetical protein
MILEANRFVSDWLADATDGVNALLPTTPLDGSDVAPADIETITDETQDNDVAREELPGTLPAIAVSVDGIPFLEGQVQVVSRDGKVKLRVRIGVENADTAEGKRDLSYYLRTAVRSLNRLFDSDANDARRTRNEIYLETCEEMTSAIAKTKDPSGNITVCGYILLTVQMRDLNPKG